MAVLPSALRGWVAHRETPTHVAALQRCRSSSSARVTYTRVICFRHEKIEIGVVHRLRGTVCGVLRPPLRPRRQIGAHERRARLGDLLRPARHAAEDNAASTTRPRSLLPAPCSHLTHAATPSTGKSNDPRRRSL